MDDYTKQSFDDCEEITATLNEVFEKYDDGCAFCRMWFKNESLEFPLNIVLFEFEQKKIHADEIKLKLALHYADGGRLYRDKEHYIAAQKAAEQKRAQKKSDNILTLASECVLPCGQFVKAGQQQDNTVILHGKIISVYKAVYDGIESLHIKIGCHGFDFDVFFDADTEPYPQIGNILCARYNAAGLALN